MSVVGTSPSALTGTFVAAPAPLASTQLAPTRWTKCSPLLLGSDLNTATLEHLEMVSARLRAVELSDLQDITVRFFSGALHPPCGLGLFFLKTLFLFDLDG